MKLLIICTMIFAHCNFTTAMLNEKDQAKAEFQQSSGALRQQYVTQRPEHLITNTERMVNAYETLEVLSQNTPESRATLTQHFQQLINIVRANLPPEARANGL